MAFVSLLDAQAQSAIIARENGVRLIRLSILSVRGVVPSSRQAPRQPAALTMYREMISFRSVEASGTNLVFRFVARVGVPLINRGGRPCGH